MKIRFTLFESCLMGGQETKNNFKILPFHGVVDYDFDCEYTGAVGNPMYTHIKK